MAINGTNGLKYENSSNMSSIVLLFVTINMYVMFKMESVNAGDELSYKMEKNVDNNDFELAPETRLFKRDDNNA